jgi:ketosteroid isomerase-like protein
VLDIGATNVEIVRTMLDAWERGDVMASIEPLDPEVVWVEPGPDRGVYHGVEGIGRSVTRWEDFRQETVEVLDAGDRVVQVSIQSGRGKGTGIPVERTWAIVWTLRAGKVVRGEMFEIRGEAIQAAGLAG